MHLAVQLPDPQATASGQHSSIKMLYKVSEGPVKDAHYGLALANVARLPEPLLRHASAISKELTRISEAKKDASTAKAIAVSKRRKLILSLKEQLIQARDSEMEGEQLREWLQKLKEEFCVRMGGIDMVESMGVGPAIGGDARGVEYEMSDPGNTEDHPLRIAEKQSVAGTEAEESSVVEELGSSSSVVEVDRHGDPISREGSELPAHSKVHPNERVKQEKFEQEVVEVEEQHEETQDYDFQDVDQQSLYLNNSGNMEEEEWGDAEEYFERQMNVDESSADAEKDWMRAN